MSVFFVNFNLKLYVSQKPDREFKLQRVHQREVIIGNIISKKYQKNWKSKQGTMRQSGYQHRRKPLLNLVLEGQRQETVVQRRAFWKELGLRKEEHYWMLQPQGDGATPQRQPEAESWEKYHRICFSLSTHPHIFCQWLPLAELSQMLIGRRAWGLQL